MGKHRLSQDNDQKRAGQQQSGKQQHADSDKTSSRPAARNAQQQQNQGSGRSQQLGSGDGATPRAGSNRDADNPSLSANQEDRRGQQTSQDSVESLQGEQGGGNDEKNSRQR